MEAFDLATCQRAQSPNRLCLRHTAVASVSKVFFLFLYVEAPKSRGWYVIPISRLFSLSQIVGSDDFGSLATSTQVTLIYKPSNLPWTWECLEPIEVRVNLMGSPF